MTKKINFPQPISGTSSIGGPQKQEGAKEKTVEQKNNDASVFNQDKADKAKEEQKKGGAVGANGMGKLELGNEGASGAGVDGAGKAGNVEGGSGNVNVGKSSNEGANVNAAGDSGKKEGYEQGKEDGKKEAMQAAQPGGEHQVGKKLNLEW